MKEPQDEAVQPPSRAQPVQQIAKEPQRVTTKSPKKVKAGKRLAESNHKKREVKKQSETTGQQSKPILWNWGCLSSGNYRWSWLLHLSNQERRATTKIILNHTLRCNHRPTSFEMD